MSLVESDGTRVSLPHIDLADGVSTACDGDEACHQSAADADGPLARLYEDTDEPDTRLVRRSGRKHPAGIHCDHTDDVIAQGSYQDGDPGIVHHLAPCLPVPLVRQRSHLMAASTVVHSPRPGMQFRQRIAVPGHRVANVDHLGWLCHETRGYGLPEPVVGGRAEYCADTALC